jgi:hypothetical protein
MSTDNISNSWQPPDPPEGDDRVTSVDPRVDTEHVIGALPCPRNPPPPLGWVPWGKKPVSPSQTEFAKTVLHDATTYPMGTFVQALIDGTLVGARVEWHTFQGSTGKTGCFRGVTLLKHQPPV